MCTWLLVKEFKIYVLKRTKIDILRMDMRTKQTKFEIFVCKKNGRSKIFCQKLYFLIYYFDISFNFTF